MNVSKIILIKLLSINYFNIANSFCKEANYLLSNKSDFSEIFLFRQLNPWIMLHHFLGYNPPRFYKQDTAYGKNLEKFTAQKILKYVSLSTLERAF